MENFNPRPGDDPQDAQPTQQFWPAPDGAAGHRGPGGAGYGPGGGAGYGSGGAGYGSLGEPGPSGGPGGPSAPGGPGFGGPGFTAPGPGGPAYPGNPGHHWQQPPGPAAHLAKDRRKARRWIIAVVAAVVAIGGTVAGVTLAGHPSGSGPTGQAAALNAVLSSADSGTANPGTGGSQPSATTASRPCARAVQAEKAAGRPRLARIAGFACRRRLLVRALMHGIHGQFTFSTAKGTRTLAFERGTISSVAAGRDIVVHATDGTTWTWDIVGNTVVRERGAAVTTSALSAGETAWVGGPVVAGTRDARLIVIRPAGAAPSTSGG